MAERSDLRDKGKENASLFDMNKPEESTGSVKFPAEEEAAWESNEKKAQANALFTSARYENAIIKYEEAVAICPHYLDYDLAVLKCNIAACHFKLEQWKEAVKSATESLDGLKRVEQLVAGSDEDADADGEDKKEGNTDEEAEEEIISSGAKQSAPAAKIETSAELAKRKRLDDILRIRAKALTRRARARCQLGGWSDLAGAEEDYKALSTMTNLSTADRHNVRTMLRLLPPRVKAAQEKEMGEMWGKLKDLGNGILKPFGLSTENFNMVKDEKTGGYSMNFNQNPPSQ